MSGGEVDHDERDRWAFCVDCGLLAPCPDHPAPSPGDGSDG